MTHFRCSRRERGSLSAVSAHLHESQRHCYSIRVFDARKSGRIYLAILGRDAPARTSQCWCNPRLMGGLPVSRRPAIKARPPSVRRAGPLGALSRAAANQAGGAWGALSYGRALLAAHDADSTSSRGCRFLKMGDLPTPSASQSNADGERICGGARSALSRASLSWAIASSLAACQPWPLVRAIPRKYSAEFRMKARPHSSGTAPNSATVAWRPSS